MQLRAGRVHLLAALAMLMVLVDILVPLLRLSTLVNKPKGICTVQYYSMKIYLASDHAGFVLKASLVALVHSLRHEAVDAGAVTLDETDDYPLCIAAAAAAVSRGEAERAIVLGGSGTGEAVVANRFPGVRAAVYYGGPLDIIRLSREHNDANVLSLGARFVSDTEAAEAVKLWLETPFTAEERHVRRIAQIEEVTRS